ncbi:hypothetical protein V6N13_121848 [Hibiscus sabdariffa]
MLTSAKSTLTSAVLGLGSVGLRADEAGLAVGGSITGGRSSTLAARGLPRSGNTKEWWQSEQNDPKSSNFNLPWRDRHQTQRRRGKDSSPARYSGEAPNGNERTGRGYGLVRFGTGRSLVATARRTDVGRVMNQPKTVGFRRMLRTDFVADGGLEWRVTVEVRFRVGRGSF